MPLPGKLCIGILEEDNPLKSYFCFKPLLIEENGRYVPFEKHDAYPEDGCIRIVPDKNESSHFKARMRRIGLFAVVDLREHPNENDKIRLNKNYHGDESERNAHIIYSDVVREPSPGMIFSLLPLRPEEAENTLLSDAPDAPSVLLRPEETVLEGAWSFEPAEGEDAFRLHSDPAPVPVEDLQIFDLPGFHARTLSFAILPPEKVPSVAEPLPGKPSAAPAEPRKEPEPRPVPKHPPEPAAAESEPADAKPWISHSELFAPAAAASRGSAQQRALAGQTGLNPRRSRSLMEIIDDKWKRSRLEQLGHPVPEIATASPVQSPVEKAIAALRNAWAARDQRGALADAMVQLEGAEIAMDARRAALRESAVNAQLNELEAQRLKMLSDLEELKRSSSSVREALKQEIRRDEAEAFADAVRKTERAQAECIRQEAEANRARAAAESVEDALRAMTDGRFEQRLQEFAVNSRAVELLRRPEKSKPAPPAVTGCSATADELILRVRTCFADAGCTFSHTEAVNLLVCASQSPMLLLSGAPESGKTTTVRLLARALGIESDRLIVFAPGKEPLTDDERLRALSDGDVPAIALLEDANLIDSGDPTRGLYPGAESGGPLLCATVQDDGHPLSASLLSRAFTLRLSEDAPDSPWPPREVSAPKVYAPVSRESLQRAFAPQPGDLPASVTKRMEALRSDLALLGIRFSRGTLNALWRYCAAAIPLMPLEPSAVLDLALAQRALPAILASAPLYALAALPRVLGDLPRCKALLEQPLPVSL